MRMSTGRRRHRQRGAALLAAMVIVVLVVTMAGAMVWQQWRSVQVEAAERARTQAEWMLQGAGDWARLILREDARSRKPTALNEPWATPLEEARLSTFLAADVSNAQDAPDVFLSGRIDDLQARFNLTSLLEGDQPKPEQLEVLKRLCRLVGVAEEVAVRIAEGLGRASNLAGVSGEPITVPLKPVTVAQLAWLGVDAESIQRLRPYVVLLPQPTAVNANTASREVLAAAVPGLDLGGAERLVQARAREPFRDTEAIKKLLPANQPFPATLTTVSNYFDVRGRLRLDDRVVEQRLVVERRGLDQVVIRREIVPSVESMAAPR